MSKLLRLQEVARRLDQSVKTVRRLIGNRDLPAVQLSSRAWRVDEQDLERFITERSTRMAKSLRFRAHVSNG